jgi:hypothetical protein
MLKAAVYDAEKGKKEKNILSFLSNIECKFNIGPQNIGKFCFRER